MTEADYKSQISLYTDRYGLIKPNIGCNDSGNGLLYSSVNILIERMKGYKSDIDKYINNINSCMKSMGLLMRTPDNTYGYEQYDDYLAVIAGCISINNTSIPRQILKYAILHGCYMDNLKQGLSGKPFLIRYPQLWILTFIASFPIFKYLFYPILWTITELMCPDINDPSGTQLQWIFITTLETLYNTTFDNWHCKFNDIYGPNQLHLLFTKYYDKDHPFSKVTNT